MLNRKLFPLILLVGIIALSNNVKGQHLAKEQSWKSIIILQTTRLEVEKQFGKPTEFDDNIKFQSLYKQKDYNLLVYYEQGCRDNKDRYYNVPFDTITHLNVYLKEPMPLSAFNIDTARIDITIFEKTVFPQYTLLDEINKGITYRLTDDETAVIEIDFRPKKGSPELCCVKQ